MSICFFDNSTALDSFASMEMTCENAFCTTESVLITLYFIVYFFRLPNITSRQPTSSNNTITLMLGSTPYRAVFS